MSVPLMLIVPSMNEQQVLMGLDWNLQACLGELRQGQGSCRANPFEGAEMGTGEMGEGLLWNNSS